MFDWKKRIRNKAFWVAMFAFIALTGKTFGLYDVPAGWDAWVNIVLAMLTAMGVIINPTTEGLKD